MSLFSDLTAAEIVVLRTNLARALASGHQSVTYSAGGTTRTIQYQSRAEMEATLRSLGAGSSFADRAQTATTTRNTESG